MFDTGFRQLRMALSMVWGRRIDPANVSRLVADALATLAEFGEPGSDVANLTDGPMMDATTRDQIAATSLRRTARRLGKQSPFYARRFAAAEVSPAKLDMDTLRRVPVTVKADLIRQQSDFICADATRHLATRTTGTTGRPAEIWLSRYEVDLWAATGALAAVLRELFLPTDIMQVNVSSRATAAVQLDVATCRLAGASCTVVGIVPPDEALDSLCRGEATLLSSNASYLSELVVAARRRGLGPDDFRLRRIDVGGEVLSPVVAAAAAETFGAPVNDIFSMTEVIPVSARTCSHGHLHHDINTGMIECLDLETGEPAAHGALATVVITPYFPYRECMPVFRYDTRDVVLRLDPDDVTCEIAAMPATSKVLGKADHLLRLGPGHVVTPRQLIEAIEALPAQPWPARFGAAVNDGHIRLTLPCSAIDGLDQATAKAHFADHGVDAVLDLVSDDEARALRPLRSDLRETTFVTRSAPLGA